MAHLGSHFEPDMEELPQATVVSRRCRIVAKGGSVLVGRPCSYFLRERKFCGIDVDDRGIRPAEFFSMIIGLRVNLLCQGQSIAVCLSQSDQLFEPCRAGCLEMQACVEFSDDAMNWCVNRKLIAS